MKKQLLSIGLLVSMVPGTFTLQAQVKIGDNETTISDASLLELESTDKGVLLPRLTTAQRDAQTNWEAGHFIYNSTDSCIQEYDGSKWECLISEDLDEWIPFNDSVIVARRAYETGDTVAITEGVKGGRLGIGTTNPGNALHIYGATNLETAKIEGPTVSKRAGFISLLNSDLTDGNGSAIHFRSATDANPNREYGAIAVENNSHNDATRSGTMRFYTSNPAPGVAKMTILPAGNVGIGTLTPLEKLHVDANNDSLQFENLAGTGDLLGINAAGKVYKTSGDGDAWGVTSEDQISNITRTGKVGIGVVPDAKLDIVGPGPSLGFKITKSTGNGGRPQILLNENRPAGGSILQRGIQYKNEKGGDTSQVILGALYGGGDLNYFFINTDAQDVGIAPHTDADFVVLDDGNVGVGTITPNEKFEVNGTIKATDINFTGLPIYANDAAAGTGGLVAGDVYKTATGELRIKL